MTIDRSSGPAGSLTWTLSIDFGTSSTVVVASTPDGQVEVIEVDGERRIPSVLLLEDDDRSWVVGQVAVDLARSHPTRIIRAPKRRLGDQTPLIVAGNAFRAVALVAEILRFAADAAIRSMGSNPSGVRMTYPATWSRPMQARLAEAAGAAGLPEPIFITEPVAAAFSIPRQPAAGAEVAIYDLGGGTFDTTIVRSTSGGYEVIGRPTGDPAFGGELFDEILLNHVGEQLDEDIWENLQISDEPEWLQTRMRLLNECRRVKEALTTSAYADITVGHPTGLIEHRVTRPQLDALVAPYIDESVELLDRAIADAGIQPRELDAIHLIGGASRMPIIRERVSKAFEGVDIHQLGDPRTAVALGAAKAATSAAETRPVAPATAAASPGTQPSPAVPTRPGRDAAPTAPPTPDTSATAPPAAAPPQPATGAPATEAPAQPARTQPPQPQPAAQAPQPQPTRTQPPQPAAQAPPVPAPPTPSPAPAPPTHAQHGGVPTPAGRAPQPAPQPVPVHQAASPQPVPAATSPSSNSRLPLIAAAVAGVVLLGGALVVALRPDGESTAPSTTIVIERQTVTTTTTPTTTAPTSTAPTTTAPTTTAPTTTAPTTAPPTSNPDDTVAPDGGPTASDIERTLLELSDFPPSDGWSENVGADYNPFPLCDSPLPVPPVHIDGRFFDKGEGDAIDRVESRSFVFATEEDAAAFMERERQLFRSCPGGELEIDGQTFTAEFIIPDGEEVTGLGDEILISGVILSLDGVPVNYALKTSIRQGRTVSETQYRAPEPVDDARNDLLLELTFIQFISVIGLDR